MGDFGLAEQRHQNGYLGQAGAGLQRRLHLARRAAADARPDASRFQQGREQQSQGGPGHDPGKDDGGEKHRQRGAGGHCRHGGDDAARGSGVPGAAAFGDGGAGLRVCRQPQLGSSRDGILNIAAWRDDTRQVLQGSGQGRVGKRNVGIADRQPQHAVGSP